jgi:hypothetical protein
LDFIQPITYHAQSPDLIHFQLKAERISFVVWVTPKFQIVPTNEFNYHRPSSTRRSTFKGAQTMRIHLFISMFILMIITIAQPSRAVQVITSDTTWSGTVNLTQDVIVSNNAVLTVSPGTEVIAASTDAGPADEGSDTNRIELLVIDGTLRAQSAVFRGESGIPACWRGIVY